MTKELFNYGGLFLHQGRWHIPTKRLEIIEKDQQFCLYAVYATGRVCIDKSYNVWQMLDLKRKVESL